MIQLKYIHIKTKLRNWNEVIMYLYSAYKKLSLNMIQRTTWGQKSVVISENPRIHYMYVMEIPDALTIAEENLLY